MKLYTFALSALAIGALASCSNDIKDPAQDVAETLKMELAQAPDFVAWSGENYFGDTRANTRASEETTEKHKPLRNDVEINLSINDLHQDETGANYDTEDFVSKLSIHIRNAYSDVAVRIPVGERFYCNQDDLYIFNSHKLQEGAVIDYAYGHQEIAYTVFEGKDVTLSIDFQSEYIEVTTSGVDNEVIAYCEENYHDGLNFEIYNYYHGYKPEGANDDFEVINLEDLKTALDGSTVNFVNIPEFYVNAFGRDNVDRDCEVVPGNGYFEGPVIGEWNNGSDLNKIYKKNLPPVPVY